MKNLPNDRYLEAFDSFEKEGRSKIPSWLLSIQKKAISRFSEVGFPTPRNEDWKYTNVAPIEKSAFHFLVRPSTNGFKIQKIEPFLLNGANGPSLVFINGFYSPDLSKVTHLPEGVKIGNLSQELKSNSDIVEPYLAKIVSFEQNGFTALNTAFIHDGGFVYLPKGATLKEPIQFLFISYPSEKNFISQPRNLIIADKGSKAVLIESYVSLSEVSYFTNGVTEIVLQEGASLDHYKIQKEDKDAFHVATTQVSQHRDSAYFSFSLSAGAKLGRENLNVILDAEGTECILNGLYLVFEGQHIDHHTVIDHLKPKSRSRQLYKGILKGKSTAVFNGKIFVRPGAQKTDAQQTNKNLLLSEEATVDTKPQLEILTDDVKCTHGAAIGQLDEDQIFYLKSRGIDDANARGLLTHGFASEVLNQVKIESVRSELDNWVSEVLA